MIMMLADWYGKNGYREDEDLSTMDGDMAVNG